MNIFFIDENPYSAARMLVNKHVNKMILESAQLLCTTHRVLDGHLVYTGKRKHYLLSPALENVFYRETHVNHPCAIWTRKTQGNYRWLWQHFDGLCREYTHRWGKIHNTSNLLIPLSGFPKTINQSESITTVPLAMPDEFKEKDPVTSYRNYYRVGKSHLHKWTNREPPQWMKGEQYGASTQE